MSTSQPLEKLKSPPIVEVVCGVIFEPMPQFDALVAGCYWNARKLDYPRHQLMPAVIDGTFLSFSPVPPLRAWLVSADDVWVVQMQQDRFYMNWRARGEAYPHFASDERGGLLARTLLEFDRFAQFCRETLGVAPKPAGIDVTKVDHLRQGRHWDDFADLARCIPWLGKLAEFSRSNDPQVAVRFAENRDGSNVVVSATTQIVQDEAGRASNVLALESRITRHSIDRSLRDTFLGANAELNGVFASMIPETERNRRFGGHR